MAREQARDQLLGGGLSHRAGDAHHLYVMLPAPVTSEILQRLPGGAHQHDRWPIPLRARPVLVVWQVLDQGPSRAVTERLHDEARGIVLLAAKCREELAAAN